MARTGIIATLGPASESEAVIRRMTNAGLDVVRINCSHTRFEDRDRMLAAVGKIDRSSRRRLRVLLDLEGPRIRVGRLLRRRPLETSRGGVVWLVRDRKPGEGKHLPLDYEGSFEDFRGAEHVFIDDGNIVLKIEEVHPDRVKAKVLVEGSIREFKGVNIPGAKLEFPAFTPKDAEDVEYGVAHKVDFIAQSFVRSAADVEAVRSLVGNRIRGVVVIAKIENREGIEAADSIIDSADGIMIARGDMGVSMPIQDVPIIQKVLIKKCNWKQKPAITATQMLESMGERLRPTRAEVADVANAIIDGTDYVMLSGETAIGKHPVEAVRMMNEVIETTESAILKRWVG